MAVEDTYDKEQKNWDCVLGINSATIFKHNLICGEYTHYERIVNVWEYKNLKHL